MKIGILTIHRAPNDGSVLQAFCLQGLLESMFPEHKIELIDYRPRKFERLMFRQSIKKRFPFIRYANWEKRKHLIHFLNQHCTISPSSLTSDDIVKARHFINKQRYDAIIVGSDTVWQIPNKILEQDIPHIYFLPEIADTKKIAFAPSSDILDRSILDENNNREKLISCITDFAFISYRDETARILLSELHLPENSYHYLADPTILYDFSPLVNSSGMKISGGPPLAGIAISQENIKSSATKWFLNNGYRVVNLLGYPTKGHIPLSIDFYRSLSQRLCYFQNLDVLVTDRFHSSIITLKLAGAPVIFIEPAKKYKHSISKGRDLFRRLGMEEMVWRYSSASGHEIPIGDYLNRWKELSINPQEALVKLRQSCNEALEQLKALLSNNLAM